MEERYMSTTLTILGGGPGGYAAALVAAQKGLQVTLIEESHVGGTCLNWGCIPTKALLTCSELYSRIKDASKYGIKVDGVTADLAAMQARKDKVVTTLRTGIEGLLKKRQVRVVKARGILLDSRTIEANGEKYSSDYIIIATGTEVLRLWQGEGLITSDEALGLTSVPESMLVVGAGAVGLEMACFYSELGSKVSVVEMMPHILPGMDTEITDSLAREFKKKGVITKTACKVEKIDGRQVIFSDGFQGTYSLILQAVGRKYRTGEIGLEAAGLTAEKGRINTDSRMETSEKGVYAIGDIVAGSPLLAHSATAQGIVAALNCAGESAVMEYHAVPGCIYTHPEVASVGLREDEVPGAKVAKVAYRVMGKAHASGEIAGLIKIIAEPVAGTVKGVHIMGEKATEIIHEGITAVTLGLKIHDLGRVIRAHPTFSEIYSEAFHAMEGRAIHCM
jgi:dihydrolipoamide dehydrogenase